MTDRSGPVDAASGWLLHVMVEEVTGVVPLPLGDVVVGSSASSDIVLAHATVSRRHARLRIDHDGVRIEDLGSLNGTRLEGRVLHQMEPFPVGVTVALGVAEIRLARSAREDGESSSSGVDDSAAVTRSLGLEAGEAVIRGFLLDLVPRLVAWDRPALAATNVARGSAEALLAVTSCRGVSVAIGDDEVVSARGAADGFVATATATAGRVTVRMDFASEGEARRARDLATTVAEMVRRAGRTPTRDHGRRTHDGGPEDGDTG
jgi:pSer/pThr/pTyr-binding forkhead associated (FHA) protein